MNDQTEILRVTSHVARDLLQSAALFHQAANVIWEYVSNGLQYVDPGTQPRVTVKLDRKPRKISIEDNGRGMDMEDLNRFFTMHAENMDRAKGRPGRGYFGTGKSAAFAIGDVLRITTSKGGRESIVELHRADLDAARSGAPVPVRVLEAGRHLNRPNGTTIEIEKLKQVRIDRDDIVRALERHIRHWRGAVVEVDGIEVENTVPPTAFTREYVAGVSDHEAIRGAQLSLSAAKIPLPEHERGVAILADGVLHDTTLAGADRKDFANYIFGEVDVPALAEPYNGISAFDMSRSGRLNLENPVVVATYSFVGRAVEELRRELVEADRQRRARAEVARLQAQAREIARLINEDYSEFRRRFAGQPRSLAGIEPAASRNPADEGTSAFVRGGDEPAKKLADEGSTSNVERPGEHQGANGQLGPTVDRADPEEADEAGHEQVTREGKNRNAGGFDVEYRNNGEETPRALYERDGRTIYINLDHPQIAAARGGGEIEDPNFRRLSFEVAFTEYAIGFAQEMATAGFYQDLFEPIQEVRERIDSVARRAAGMFRSE